MNYIRQLIRQPFKFISGVIVIALAVAVLCVCLGQSVAADKTKDSLAYNFTTIALPTTKYQYAQKEFNGIPYTAFSESLPEEIVSWIEDTVSDHPELIETVSAPGLASACISNLTPDNLTRHKYDYPWTGTQESWVPHKLEASPSYACAMFEIVLDEIGEPFESVVEGLSEDGSAVSVTTEVEITLAGMIKSVVSLEEGYDDPTGRTIYLTLVLPDLRSFEEMGLKIGERYLVYGTDYLDLEWALQGYISDRLSAWLNYSVELEALCEEDFYYYTEAELKALAELNPYSTVIAQYQYDGIFAEIPAEMMKWHHSVSMTLEDRSILGVYERAAYSDGSGTYPSLNWERWITDGHGNEVQITQEEYRERYAVPTITRLEDTAEEFLQSESGRLWAGQLKLMEVNYQTFPVIGVDKLGYVAENDMGISLKNVSYSYEGKFQTVKAVDGISYEFEPGKCYAIIGKSGSGKTTLLSLMAGLDMPSEGEIIVQGRSTKEWDRNKMRRDAVSVIYQNYNLFPLLTVQENIKYPLNLKGMPKKEAQVLARKMRERVDLPASYDNRLPSHLSGGEQQRTAIARTLAQGCKIILADEPTGNLDSTNTHNIIEILCSLAHDEGCTVIIVTHDPSVAEQADVILQMKDGAWI